MCRNIYTVAFIRFHVSKQIEFWVSRDGLSKSWWEVFGDLGVTVCGLREYRNVDNFLRIPREGCKDTRLERM